MTLPSRCSRYLSNDNLGFTSQNASTVGTAGNHIRSRVAFILKVIIESGAVISAAKITEFVLFKTQPHNGSMSTTKNGYDVVFEAVPQIVVSSDPSLLR
jgi:hypothetical protein